MIAAPPTPAAQPVARPVAGPVARLVTPERKRLLIGAVIAVHLLTFVFVIGDPNYLKDEVFRGSDAARYAAIASDLNHGRSVAVEYPPGAVVMMRAIGGRGVVPTLRWLALLNAIADLIIAVVLARGWSKSVAICYGALAAPMLVFLVNGYDLLVVALVVVGLACVRRDRIALGAVVLTVAAMGKLWPVVFIASFWIWGRRKAAAAFAATFATALVGWIISDGVRGVTDVVAYRGARGWHVESVPGAILAVITGATSRYEAGSWRVGAPPKLSSLMLLVATAGVMAYVARLATKDLRSKIDAHAEDREHLLAVSIIAVLMAGATLLSPQYIIWLVPFLAMVLGTASTRRSWHRRVSASAIALVAMNTFYIAANDLAAPDVFATRIEAVLRNGCLVWLIFEIARALRSGSDHGTGTVSPVAQLSAEALA